MEGNLIKSKCIAENMRIVSFPQLHFVEKGKKTWQKLGLHFVKRSSAAPFYVGTHCVTTVIILVIVITMIIVAKVQLGCRTDDECLIS